MTRIEESVEIKHLVDKIFAYTTGAKSWPEWQSIIICSIAAGIAICVFLTSPTVRNYRLSQAIDTDLARTHADSST